MSLTLGLDVGTQGTKAVLWDGDSGVVVARASRSYDLIAGLSNGAAEQDPSTWRTAVKEVLQELKGSAGVDFGGIQAIGVSGQQHGCVVLDEKDQPVRAAKLWCDTSTVSEAQELSEAFGRSVPTGFTASKLLWLARNEPANWARTRRVLLPHDYINLLLTGEAAMEAGDASGTGLFDVVERDFDHGALEKFDILTKAAQDPGLASRLPRLLNAKTPTEAMGRVSASAAAEFGLKPGILVAPGGGDNMMSAIGSGATVDGVVTVSLGTSGTVFAHASHPVIDPEGLIAPFCGSTGGWLPLLCVMNLTGVTEEVRACSGLDHPALTAAARDIPAGCDGLLWLPYLNGERVPDLPHATGSLLGMRPGHLRPGTLYRAALEGTSLNLAWGAQRLSKLGVPIQELRVVGGASRNLLWREILASCLGVPVLPLEEPESAALGAAMQALWCLHSDLGDPIAIEQLTAKCVKTSGEATAPDQEMTATYAELAPRFREQAMKS
jgi:xylulokinase